MNKETRRELEMELQAINAEIANRQSTSRLTPEQRDMYLQELADIDAEINRRNTLSSSQQNNEETGVGGVIRDVGQGIAAAPRMLYETAKALPEEFKGAFEQSPERIGKNLLAGVAELGHGIINAPSTAANYLAKKEFISPETAEMIPRQQEHDYANLVGLEGEQPGDRLIRGIPESPLWALGGGSNFITKGAAEAAKYGAMGAIHEQNPATLAALGTGVHLGAKAIGKGLAYPAGVLESARKGFKGELTPRAMEIEALGKQHGVDLLAGDMAPHGGNIQGLTEFAEKIPGVNVVSERLAQKKQLTAAAERTAENMRKKMINENFLDANGIQRLQTIANGKSPRANAAKSLLQDIETAGADWNLILKTSGKAKLLNSKINSDILYDNVGKLSEPYGYVGLDKTINAINESLEELKKIPKTNAAPIKALEEFKQDINKDLNFNDVRNVRRAVSKKIDDYSKGNLELVGKSGVEHFSKIYNTLEDDLHTFALSHGEELSKAWKEADHYYKKNVVPYKERALANAFKNSSNPDEIYGMFIKNGGAEGEKGTARAAKFYNALDNKGRSAVRYGMFKRAIDASTNEHGFSPAKFATNLEKLESSRGIFLKGGDAIETKGLIKLMRAAERAGQMKTPDTGVKLFAPLALAEMALAPATGVAGYGLKQLVTTPGGKRILFAIGNTASTTKQFAKNLDKANEFLAKSAKNYSLSTAKEHKEKR